MSRRILVVLAAVIGAVLGASPARAQFSNTEVSAIGKPPFLWAKRPGATFESIAAVTYNIYRRVPTDGFRCLTPDLPTNAWNGVDLAGPPAGQAWWYSVNAFDGTDENRHGNSIAILQPCKQPPIPVTKTVAPPSVLTGQAAKFTIVIDNSAGTSPLTGCTLTDDVKASGCMTLSGCGTVTPPLPGLSCNTTTSVVSAAGFTIAAGATQTIEVNVTAGTTAGACLNQVSIVCGARSGMAQASLAITAGVPAEILVLKYPEVSVVPPDNQFKYTIVVENPSAQVASNLRISDVMDPCMILRSCDSSTPPLGAALVCNPPSGFTASGFDLAPGATQTITFTANSGGTPMQSCPNTVTVSGDNFPTVTSTGTVAIDAACTPLPGATPLRAVQVASGLASPVFLTSIPGDLLRLFVVEQAGRIRIVRGGTVVATPFLDIRSVVLSGGERGLLSMAFHPQYATNGKFYVYYTRQTDGAVTVAEYQVSANPDVADSTTARVVFNCPHPSFSNHNGGQLNFGPRDGYLYIGLGDGGSGGDPNGNGQNLGACLGKILRIDVDGTAPPLEYRIPPDNPFITTPGARREVWVYGVRNPWRYSFDRATGDLYIGDVGQGRWEEVDVREVQSRESRNYGWNVIEGNGHCYQPATGCDPTGKINPVTEYSHSVGASITGGYVYRGCRLRAWAGTYFYADYATNKIFAFDYQRGTSAAHGPAINPQDLSTALAGPTAISSFGEDAQGEIYILNLGGTVWKIQD